MTALLLVACGDDTTAAGSGGGPASTGADVSSATFRSSMEGDTLVLETTAMVPGRTYLIEAADQEEGPFTTVLDRLSVAKVQRARFEVPDATRAVYRFRE